jgi:hypothetical protein
MRALVLLLSTLVVCWPAAVQAGTARPALELVSIDPLRIRGQHFRAYERVRVTAWADGRRYVVATRAGQRGRFVVTVRTTAPPCDLAVSAIGRRGSKAEFTLSHVICPPTP